MVKRSSHVSAIDISGSYSTYDAQLSGGQLALGPDKRLPVCDLCGTYSFTVPTVAPVACHITCIVYFGFERNTAFAG
jgi:hypothetical protein